MRTKSTLVAIFFIASGIILAWLLSVALASLFAVLRITDTSLIGDRVTLTRVLGIVIAAAVAVGTYSWSKTRLFTGEVAEELNKVNWPTWPETKVNTLVVIVTSVIAALILGVFDMTFGMLSTWLAANV
jgi:preprotein translocase SecE subunit